MYGFHDRSKISPQPLPHLYYYLIHTFSLLFQGLGLFSGGARSDDLHVFPRGEKANIVY